MKIKKNDFIEVDYTSILKDGNDVFDTTIEKIAKDNGFQRDGIKYTPVILCVGQHNIFKAIDESFENRSVGESYRVELRAEDAFGRKDSNFIKFMPTKSFTEHKINPVPGLNIDVDGVRGILKVVSGGRTLVDFNHPLAGRDLIYEINIRRIVEDKTEKLKALFFNILSHEPELEIKENEVVVNLPEGININEGDIHSRVMELIPEITTLKFNHIKKK